MSVSSLVAGLAGATMIIPGCIQICPCGRAAIYDDILPPQPSASPAPATWPERPRVRVLPPANVPWYSPPPVPIPVLSPQASSPARLTAPPAAGHRPP
jgi:hypothetical protein